MLSKQELSHSSKFTSLMQNCRNHWHKRMLNFIILNIISRKHTHFSSFA